MKSVRIRSFSGPYSVRMRKSKDQKTPNTGTFHAVIINMKRHRLVQIKVYFKKTLNFSILAKICCNVKFRLQGYLMENLSINRDHPPLNNNKKSLYLEFFDDYRAGDTGGCGRGAARPWPPTFLRIKKKKLKQRKK